MSCPSNRTQYHINIIFVITICPDATRLRRGTIRLPPMKPPQSSAEEASQNTATDAATVTGQFARGQFTQKNEKIKVKKPNLT